MTNPLNVNQTLNVWIVTTGTLTNHEVGRRIGLKFLCQVSHTKTELEDRHDMVPADSTASSCVELRDFLLANPGLISNRLLVERLER